MLILTEDLEVLNNQLQGTIFAEMDTNGGSTNSRAYVIHDSVAILFNCLYTRNNINKAYFTVNLSFFKLSNEDKNSYRLKLISTQLNVDNKMFTTVDEGTWHMIYINYQLLKQIDVNATVEVIKYQAQNTTPSLVAIHDDTELTDFEMEAVDGSVRVHRAVLAAASPVLRRMLCGEWREAASGRVQLPDTTRQTLQHLKDFAYLGVLPEDESALRPLLLVAAYLMMPELEGRCVLALVDTLTPDTAYELLEFAFINKRTKLVRMIIERMEKGKVKCVAITIPSETS